MQGSLMVLIPAFHLLTVVLEPVANGIEFQ